MSHFSEQPRPTMRRKSSAQNLLSSFKSSASSAPVNIASSSTSSSSGVPYSPPNGNTPVSTTPLAREWDAQSMHSDGLGGAGSPALPQGTSVEYLRDLVQKRIITLTYIRNIHEGCVHFLRVSSVQEVTPPSTQAKSLVPYYTHNSCRARKGVQQRGHEKTVFHFPDFGLLRTLITAQNVSFRHPRSITLQSP